MTMPGSPPRRLGFWIRWVALLDEREPGTTLALFRIACGVCILYSIGSVAWNGMVPVVWLNPADGGFEYVGTGPRLFKLLGGVKPATVWPVVTITLAAGMLLVLGLGSRVTAFVALQGIIGLTGINGDAGGAYDWLLTNALWLVVLARSTATLSLDCRLRTGRWCSGETIPAWPRYVAIYQVVLMYWSTGMHKVSGAWTPAGDFSALYYILQEPTWTRWNMEGLAWVYPLTQLGTATAWIWEITTPLLLLVLWYRRTSDRPGCLLRLCNRLPLRGLWVAIGVAVHLGIWVFMDVGARLSLTALSFYLCLVRPEEWRIAGPARHTIAGNPVLATSGDETS